MYFDNKPCQACGSEVRLEAHDGRPPSTERDPDGTVDVRVCTNPECETNDGTDSPEP